MYDLRLAVLSEESDYFQWLSPSSQEDVRKCPRFYIAILYEKSTDHISHRLVANQLEYQGAKFQSIPDFWRALRMHPQFETEVLQRHRVAGICFSSPGESIILGLPGYSAQTILE